MLTNRWAILVLVMGAQTMANVGPLGIPAIASLIRDEFGLTLTQAGSFLSVYYLGPVTMSFFAACSPIAGAPRRRSCSVRA